MKGIVFSEFLEMIDDRFSMEMSERLIAETKPTSGGAYASLGTYDHREIVAMVIKLSELTSIPVPDLLKTFGRHLLMRFTENFTEFFDGSTSVFDFLPKIESYVHLEVKKLYSDAELPSFTCSLVAPDRLEMVYRSARDFSDLAEGLIWGVADYFGEQIDIKRRSLEGDPPAEYFLVTKLKARQIDD